MDTPWTAWGNPLRTIYALLTVHFYLLGSARLLDWLAAITTTRRYQSVKAVASLRLPTLPEIGKPSRGAQYHRQPSRNKSNAESENNNAKHEDYMIPRHWKLKGSITAQRFRLDGHMGKDWRWGVEKPANRSAPSIRRPRETERTPFGRVFLDGQSTNAGRVRKTPMGAPSSSFQFGQYAKLYLIPRSFSACHPPPT